MEQPEFTEVTSVNNSAAPPPEDPAQDVRGRDVYDREGEQIGSVEDLYVEAEEYEVRFLYVGAGGFLGIGEKRFMIPVEAVTDVGEDSVTIGHGLEKVKGTPDVPGEVVILPEHQREIYEYYEQPYPD